MFDRRFVCLLVVAAVTTSLGGCGSGASQDLTVATPGERLSHGGVNRFPLDPARFFHRVYPVSLQFPVGFKLSSVGVSNDGGLVRYVADNGTTFKVARQRLLGDQTADAVFQMTRDKLADVFTRAETLDAGTFQLEGKAVKWLALKHDGEGGQSTIIYQTQFGSDMYTVTATTKLTDFPTYVPCFDETVKSLRFGMTRSGNESQPAPPIQVASAGPSAATAPPTAPVASSTTTPSAPATVPPTTPSTSLENAQVDELIAALRSANTDQQLRAVAILEFRAPDANAPKVAPELVKLLDSPVDPLRVSVANALEKWATPEVGPSLVRALRDKNPTVRMPIIRTFEKLKTPEAAEAICERLNDPNDQLAASVALRNIGAVAEDALIKQLNSTNKAAVQQVCDILSEIGTPKSLGPLKVAGLTAGFPVDSYAEKARSAIQKRHPTAMAKTDGDALIDAQVEALESGDLKRVQKVLKDISNKTADKLDPRLRKGFESVVKSRDHWSAKEVAEASKSWATKESIPALLDALDHKDHFVQEPVVETLGRLKAEEAAERLGELLSDGGLRSECSKALRQIGSAAELEVQKAAVKKDHFTQIEACKILADIGTPKSIATLRALTAGGDYFVTEEAKRSIDAITRRARRK